MYSAAKRIFDVAIALLASIVAAPFSILIGVLLWCIQGSVIFRQVRPGLYGKPFVLYKFCSMSNARDEHGVLLPDDQRLTRIGLFLRSLSIDELPQLWNVLKGDMSLVGPRPLLMEYLDRYSPEQARRHNVMPGITGWAQINGRNAVNWNERFQLDLWYVDNKSFWLDLRILWITALRVLRRSGISSPGHATMEKFSGNNRNA